MKMQYTTFILLMAFVPTALVLKRCATFLLLSTSSSLSWDTRNGYWATLSFYSWAGPHKKKKSSTKIAFFPHSSSHSKKERKKKKISSKKAVGSKFLLLKSWGQIWKKLGKKKKKKACFSCNWHEGKNPSGLEDAKDLKELSPKLPSVTRTEISYSDKFLSTTLHSFEASFPPENYPSLPLRNRITSVTTKFKFICPTSIFYFLIHLSGTAFNAFGFFFSVIKYSIYFPAAGVKKVVVFFKYYS